MKRLINLLILLVTSNLLPAQEKSIIEKAYIAVIKDGASTAPEFIVITIKNLNTDETKEICTDVGSLFWSLGHEINETDYKRLTGYCISKSSQRIFTFKNKASLARLGFDNYSLKNAITIESIIEKKHLVDSLKRFVKSQTMLQRRRDDLYNVRKNILKELVDSIQTIRALSQGENKIIQDLPDRYYDEYYTKLLYNKSGKLSEKERRLLRRWYLKVKKYNTEILKFEVESKRMYAKFFKRYYEIYGINFCHVAFKHGIITYFGDENPTVGFGWVIN